MTRYEEQKQQQPQGVSTDNDLALTLPNKSNDTFEKLVKCCFKLIILDRNISIPKSVDSRSDSTFCAV